MSFWGSLTGSDQRETLKRSNAEAESALTGGYQKAALSTVSGYRGADALVDPYLKSGQKGYDAYADAIGVNGGDGYNRSFNTFNLDPFAAEEGMAARRAIQQAMQGYNAQGTRNSGMAALGAGRIASERFGNRVDDYRNRLAGFGSQGADTARFASGLKTERGNAMANLHYGYGQQMAGNKIGMGNAMAQAQTAGANNILGGITGLAGLAVQGFAPGVGGGSAFSKMFGG